MTERRKWGSMKSIVIDGAKSGKTYQQIATELGCGEDYVRKTLARSGIVGRGVHGTPAEHQMEIVARLGKQAARYGLMLVPINSSQP